MKKTLLISAVISSVMGLVGCSAEDTAVNVAGAELDSHSKRIDSIGLVKDNIESIYKYIDQQCGGVISTMVTCEGQLATMIGHNYSSIKAPKLVNSMNVWDMADKDKDGFIFLNKNGDEVARVELLENGRISGDSFHALWSVDSRTFIVDGTLEDIEPSNYKIINATGKTKYLDGDFDWKIVNGKPVIK